MLDSGFGHEYVGGEAMTTPSLAEALAGHMVNSALTAPKSISWSYQQLCDCVQVVQVAQQLAAQAFGRRAKGEPDSIKRNRLWKTLRRYVPLKIAADAFHGEGLRLVDASYRDVSRKAVTIKMDDFIKLEKLLGSQYFPRPAVTIVRPVIA